MGTVIETEVSVVSAEYAATVQLARMRVFSHALSGAMLYQLGRRIKNFSLRTFETSGPVKGCVSVNVMAPLFLAKISAEKV